jgi:hypothetical protein
MSPIMSQLNPVQGIRHTRFTFYSFKHCLAINTMNTSDIKSSHTGILFRSVIKSLITFATACQQSESQFTLLTNPINGCITKLQLSYMVLIFVNSSDLHCMETNYGMYHLKHNPETITHRGKVRA